MSRAVLSIGSNLGDRLAALRTVLAGLSDVLIAVSPLYETDPWGPVPQGPFLNAVLIVDDAGTSPRGWLERAKVLEAGAGRVRDQRWGPRALDVDVISVDADGTTVTSDDPEFTVPHPRAAERAFVIVPWLDLEPDAVLVGHGRVAELPAAAEAASVRRCNGCGWSGR
jgi:2-amino-4-hydroxy-6-hydroxymethyldihydropteridine diphosphokinase